MAETTDKAGWTCGNWPATFTPTPVHATVTVPGSKSVGTNRALVLAALATDQGTSTISGALRSRDTDLMIGVQQGVGDGRGHGKRATVSGRIVPHAAPRGLRAGRNGAALRSPGGRAEHETVTFDGDEQACARPIAPLLTALRGLGATIDGDGLPFRVHGGGSVSRRHRRDRRVGLVTVRFRADALGAAFIDGLTIVHTGESVPRRRMWR